MTDASIGLQLKERGQQLALFGAGANWIDQIMECFAQFCADRKNEGRPEFRFEEFRETIELRGYPLPASHKAWGAVPLRACRANLIEWTQEYVAATSAKTHAHPVKEWRAL